MTNSKAAAALLRIALVYPRIVCVTMLTLTLAVAAIAVLPSLWPQQLPSLAKIVIDPDPENMLPADAPVRQAHNALKREFDIHDLLLIGIVNEHDPAGVFNPQTLARVDELTQFALSLNWLDPENPSRRRGVIGIDLIAPATVDYIEPDSLGAVRFSWLMPQTPRNPAQAQAVRERAAAIPLLNGTLLSEEGQALALYLPLSDKALSYQIRAKLQAKIASFGSTPEQYHITGLPVAEDTFGVEMFVQMAISAPLAMLLIAVLLWWFFRRPLFIAAPLIVAVVSAISTLGLLIISGHTIHIMSSMIPIFIMPIAVLDAIHILSEFFDRYRPDCDRRATVIAVMRTLFSPMLLTTLTTAAGFASLALTSIPPVQVFGVFVACGVLLAWFWTIVFIPAFIMLVAPERLTPKAQPSDQTCLNRGLQGLAAVAISRARLIAVLTLLIGLGAAYGISRIEVNDNPVNWFAESHPIRVADRVLNTHFGGSYMAYLALQSTSTQAELFKQPDMLRYIAALQTYLESLDNVGKVNSLADIVRTVHRELWLGDPTQFRIPSSQAAVAQTLLTFQNSHRPQDLWHFVTPDFTKTNLWLQLKNGDNRTMLAVEKAVAQYLYDHPPPVALEPTWFGLTHVNVAWQAQMVSGMTQALLGSFLVVLVMVSLLFRSLRWGLLAMVPLSVSIGLIYGVIGLLGKDYDMPVAVLSALSLGLAIDYAIHFLVRSRQAVAEQGSWPAAVRQVFAEPARAITRNAIVVGGGFLPLLAAPLVPYQTVGLLIAAILVVAGLASLLILPALLTLFQRHLWPRASTVAFKEIRQL